MKRFVLDASVALAWCFEDESSTKADGILELFTTASAIVPAIWPVEVGNALLVGERRKRIKPADVTKSLELLRSLDIEVQAGNPWAETRDLVALARSEKLCVYDATYLFLAMREGVPVATLDQTLERAAWRLGVQVL